MIFDALLRQVSCVEQFTCLPTNPMEIFTLYNHQYGVPNPVFLGIILVVVNAALYIKTRSASILAITGIYSISIVTTTWANEAVIAPAYHSIIWIVALAVASVATMAILKVLRE